MKAKQLRMKLTRNELAAYENFLGELQYTDLKLKRLYILLNTETDEKKRAEIAGRIKSYENFKETCDRVYNQLDESLQDIFKLRYSRGAGLLYEEIAERLHYSLRSIYRKRETILTLFAQEIGRL